MEKPILNKESFPFGGIVQVIDAVGKRAGDHVLIPFLQTARADGEVRVTTHQHALRLNPEVVPATYAETQMTYLKDTMGCDATQLISAVLKTEFVNESTQRIVNMLLEFGYINRPRGWFEKLVRVFNRKYVRTRNVSNTTDMIDVLRRMRADILRRSGKNADYVVVNTKLGAILADLCYVNNGEILLQQQQNFTMYPVGKVMGLTVYVYPFMKWSDERILMGASTAEGRDGLYFVFDSASAEFITVQNMPGNAVNHHRRDTRQTKLKVDCGIAVAQTSPQIMPECQVEHLRVTKNVL